MPAHRVGAFAGMVPRTARHLLQESQAQVATNARLTSGALLPLHDAVLRNTPGIAGLKTIHRILDTAGVEYFLGWDVDVDVVIGPIAGDTSFRRYFTGDNEPRVTNLALATAGSPLPFSFFVLGVYPPQTVASLSHAGGAGAAVSRAFVYTFVTPWGEESQPSPPTAVTTGKVDGTWTIGAGPAMDVAPANTFPVTNSAWAAGIATLTVASTFGLRVGEEFSVAGMTPAGFNTASAIITALTATTISYAVAVNPGAFSVGGTVTKTAPHNTTSMTKRIYWTETTVSGTKFQFVKEIPVATTSTTVAGNTVAGEEIPSTDWPMPQVGLRGLCLHPSGAMVGFYKNVLYFSDPFKPYAWPVAFELALDFDIVGISISDTNVVVGTKGQPYLVSGVSPDSMSSSKLNQQWPCLSKRGMVSLPYGVAYPCPQGLALVGPQGTSLLTADVYTQEEWKTLKPDTFIAAAYAGRYVVSYDPGTGNRLLLIIDKTEFASAVSANKNCAALYTDVTTGILYVVIMDKIYEWDSVAAGFIIFDWMSKEFVLPKPVNMGAAKVDCDFTLTPEETAAINAARALVAAANAALITTGNYNAGIAQAELGVLSIGDVDLDDLPSAASEQMQFQLWVNNKLKFTKNVASSKAFTLPSGYKADHFAVRVTGTVRVNGIVFGETMKELEQA